MDGSAWLTLDSPHSHLEARRLEAESPGGLARSAAAHSGRAGRRRAGSARPRYEILESLGRDPVAPEAGALLSGDRVGARMG